MSACTDCREILLHQSTYETTICKRFSLSDLHVRSKHESCGLCKAMLHILKKPDRECNCLSEAITNSSGNLVVNVSIFSTCRGEQEEGKPRDIHLIWVDLWPDCSHAVDHNPSALPWLRVYAKYGICPQPFKKRFGIIVLMEFILGDPSAELISERETDPSTDSAEAYEQIQKWTADCDREHLLCRQSAPTPLPTRVIDVGTQCGTREPRLHISSPNEAHQYLALSYCWGKGQLFHLTRASLEGMCDRIDMSDLPKSLQDAITVTRKLNQRYLWIDSLCIIQDSEQDKSHEIDHMSDVYRGAHLTISAAKAYGCNEGFLESRSLVRYEKSRRWTATLPLLYGDAELGRIWIEDSSSRTDPDEPVYSRAWTLQERLLSRRQLIYGFDALTWKCRTATWGWKTWARYCFQEPLVESLGMPPPDLVAASTPKTDKPPAGKLSLYRKSDYGEYRSRRTGWPFFLEYWLKLVGMYSHLELSEYTDKLPGVAGIAAEVSRLSDATGIPTGKYLAGLWEADLPRQLLWTTRYLSKPEPGPYRAPSWSWASVPGNTYTRYPWVLDEYYFNPDAQVIECSTTPLHAGAPFGQVKDGFLKSRARLAKGTTMSEELVSANRVGVTSHREFCQIDSMAVGNLVEAAKEKALASWWIQLGECCGLILERVEPGEHLYRRVGVFHSEKASFPDVEPTVLTII